MNNPEFGRSTLLHQIINGQEWSSVIRLPLTANILESVAREYLEVVGFETLYWKVWPMSPRNDSLFLSRIDAWRDHRALNRLKTLNSGVEYDINLSGWWIRRGSTAHSLANLLGFKLYDPRKTEVPAVLLKNNK